MSRLTIRKPSSRQQPLRMAFKYREIIGIIAEGEGIAGTAYRVRAAYP